MFQTEPGLESPDPLTDVHQEGTGCDPQSPVGQESSTSSSCDPPHDNQHIAGHTQDPPEDPGVEVDCRNGGSGCSAVDCEESVIQERNVCDGEAIATPDVNQCDVSEAASPAASDDPASIGSDFQPIRLFPSETILFGDPIVTGLIILTRYRLLVLRRQQKQRRHESCDGAVSSCNGHYVSAESPFSLPIGCLDSIECRDNSKLLILTKHVKSYVCTFHSADCMNLWFRRINDAISFQSKRDNLFCFAVWNSSVACKVAKSYTNGIANGLKTNGSTVRNGSPHPDPLHENGCTTRVNVRNNDEAESDKKRVECVNGLVSLVQKLEISCLFDESIHQESLSPYRQRVDHFRAEYDRMKFSDGKWRISDLNKDYKTVTTYPQYLIVPESVTDDHLKEVSSFRSFRRMASVVWRSQVNGCVIARSSQPEVGWFGWRSDADEKMLDQILKSSLNQHPAISFTSKKLLIVDARSYAAAVANRAKGGGCECPEYYPTAEVMFMGLANIHSIRKSFQSLRLICQSPPDDPVLWSVQVETTRWLQHISGLLNSALIVVEAVSKDERPVLVHCSDGWDRTPQITSLAQLLLDPFYRTIDGIQVLVEREWIEYGHKFSDRCSNAPVVDDANEKCPVFLQWVDCVHQILKQFPTCFEFDQQFLVSQQFTLFTRSIPDRFVVVTHTKGYSLLRTLR